MSFRVPVNGLLALAWGVGGALVANGEPQSTQAMVDQALHFYGHVNSASLLEPAGSHGSVGIDCGAGLVSVLPPAGNALLTAQLGEGSGGKPFGVPRLWLVKGLPLPIDGAVTAAGPTGGSKGSGFSQISAALQWTVYEALARPAVAIRGSYGKLFGVTGTTLASAGGEVVLSYGLLNYFTFYGRAGAVRHQGTLTIEQNQLNGLGLSGRESTALTYSTSWIEPVRAAGLKFRFGATRLALTGEADLSAGLKQVDYGAKLSYDL